MNTKHETLSSYSLSVLQFAASVRAWFFLVVVMMIGRFVWYFELRARLSEDTRISDFGLVFLHGLRQDISAAGYWLIPAIVFGMLVSLMPMLNRAATVLRTVSMTIALVATPLIVYCSVGYYEAFSDVFGPMLFEATQGNTELVIGEAASNHRLVPRLLLVAIGAVIGLIVYRRVCRNIQLTWLVKTLDQKTFLSRSVACVATFSLVIAAVRGSVTQRPLQKIDSSVTKSIVLNRGVINPYIALRYAVVDHLESAQHQTRHYDPQITLSLLQQLQTTLVSNSTRNDPSSPSIELDFNLPLLKRQAKGPFNQQPSHIFLVFLESYDSWPLLDQFTDLEIVKEGKKLASEGLCLKSFLPAENSSVASYLACLQGLHESNRFRFDNSPTCLVDTLKSLRYKTREINGFPADWSRIREASEQMGFEEIYCVEDILPGGETSNHWLHDRTLYDFAESLDYSERTFNVIRSSSNHGPWEVDLEKEDCEIPALPETVDGHPVADAKRSLYYGHAKYADREMVRFVRAMIARFPDALFVITGDHYGRNYPTHFPGIYQSSSVPLILYGPEVLRGVSFPEGAAGSHLDIGPTITELCAPEGFQYLSLGKNLLDPSAPNHGIGTGYVIFPDCVVSVYEPAMAQWLPWVQKTKQEQVPAEKIEYGKQLHQLYHGLGYYLTSIPKESTQAIR